MKRLHLDQPSLFEPEGDTHERQPSLFGAEDAQFEPIFRDTLGPSSKPEPGEVSTFHGRVERFLAGKLDPLENRAKPGKPRIT